MSNILSLARIVAGFAIAPAVPGALLAGALLAADERSNAQELFLVSINFAYPIALLIGVPLFALLQRQGWTGLIAYALTGAALGAFLYVAMPMLLETLMMIVEGVDAAGHITFSLSVLPVAIGCAVVAAIAFWLIARPDRALRKSEAA